MSKDLVVPRRAAGGRAANAKRTPEERRALAQKMVAAKRERATLPTVTHPGKLKIGELEIACYVTSTGQRVLSGRGMQEALRLVDEEAPASGQKPGSRMDRFLGTKSLRPLIYKTHSPDHFAPVRMRYEGHVINGYRAEVLPDICEAMLEARDAGMLDTPRQRTIAKQCEILMRGFARVGIIALIDEATGYQRDRARDALAKILEAYVAKELQPWIKTFDSDYYEQMFRLRGLPYPPEQANYRPSYFGHLTNDIVYRRLAPGVLHALKDEARKDERKGTKLHQHLTAGYGRQELLKHLGMVVGLMKISGGWDDFMQKLNRIATRYNESLSLDLDEAGSWAK
ncbi:MAG: P63C domain-containing protein [Betaproteobacteria bacterium]